MPRRIILSLTTHQYITEVQIYTHETQLKERILLEWLWKHPYQQTKDEKERKLITNENDVAFFKLRLYAMPDCIKEFDKLSV